MAVGNINRRLVEIPEQFEVQTTRKRPNPLLRRIKNSPEIIGFPFLKSHPHNTNQHNISEELGVKN